MAGERAPKGSLEGGTGPSCWAGPGNGPWFVGRLSNSAPSSSASCDGGRRGVVGVVVAGVATDGDVDVVGGLDGHVYGSGGWVGL